MRPAFLLLILLLGCGIRAHAGIASYTDRGKIDFDTAMQLLNPYGTWAQVDGRWAYTPLDHQTPYTRGRWLYTEYGWYWKGDQPISWVTEHYGFWKRGDDHLWAWYPGTDWLPQIVEIRATATYVGWRCAEVDSDGNFVEAPADRYAKIDEWTFVSRNQFTGPITPAIIAGPELTSKLLDDSSAAMHVYTTYRAIDRPGPHPADFVPLAGDRGMFAPQIENEPLPPAKPLLGDLTTNVSTVATPKKTVPGAGDDTATNAAPDASGDDEPPADLRQVPYWITMSLPNYWTSPPPDAKPNEVYIYRPDFYQDQDGIERRIRLWLNPTSRTLQGEQLRTVLGEPSKGPAAPPVGPGMPAVPVAPEGNPFRSPFDEAFHGSSSSSKAPAQAAPSGLKAPEAATNAAPSGKE
jgi:hypothetical protein